MRALLARYRIGINEAVNGVALGNPQPHAELTHTLDFMQRTEQRLLNVEARLTAQGAGQGSITRALRRELRTIGVELAEQEAAMTAAQ
jgi:UDP-N-acetylglucosamine transferase subunit ALG13